MVFLLLAVLTVAAMGIVGPFARLVRWRQAYAEGVLMSLWAGALITTVALGRWLQARHARFGRALFRGASATLVLFLVTFASINLIRAGLIEASAKREDAAKVRARTPSSSTPHNLMTSASAVIDSELRR